MPDQEIKNRICKVCTLEKNLILDFKSFHRNGKIYYRHTCLMCERIRDKQYYIDNKVKILQRQSERMQDEEIIKIKKAQALAYYENNKKEILDKQREFFKIKENYDRKKKYNDEYNDRTGYRKNYVSKNKVLLKNKATARENKRYKCDIWYRLKKRISRAIWGQLRSNNSSKYGESILYFLSYTIEELKNYLETQFEQWMNWDNYGKYNKKNWDDDNPSTWKWNMDHIIPQSDLPYASMEDENFKKCWALSNLRPYSAKENYLDGIFRKRHKA